MWCTAATARPWTGRSSGPTAAATSWGRCTATARSPATSPRPSACPVLVLDYRRAPEHPHPAQVEDAVAAYRWLLGDQGIAPAHIATTGDSAGGGLCTSMVLALRDAGDPLPAAVMPLSPFYDMEATGDSVTTNAEVDELVQRDILLAMAGMFLGDALTARSAGQPAARRPGRPAADADPGRRRTRRCSTTAPASPTRPRRPASTAPSRCTRRCSTSSTSSPAGPPRPTRRSPRWRPGCAPSWVCNPPEPSSVSPHKSPGTCAVTQTCYFLPPPRRPPSPPMMSPRPPPPPPPPSRPPRRSPRPPPSPLSSGRLGRRRAGAHP